MRAMVLHEQMSIAENPLQIEDVPKPEPSSGEVRIKVNACGVCHTDLHEIEGDISVPDLPRIIGHQVVGIVDAVGENVEKWTEGDRVGVPWLHSTCQNCEFCHRGLENLCENAKFTGKEVDGGFAEYTVADARFAKPLDSDLVRRLAREHEVLITVEESAIGGSHTIEFQPNLPYAYIVTALDPRIEVVDFSDPGNPEIVATVDT